MILTEYFTKAVHKMQNFLHQKQTKRKQNTQELDQKMAFMVELEQLTSQIRQHEQNFNYATDDDLITALVYEHNTLCNKYLHLLHHAKEQKITLDYTDRVTFFQ